MLSTPTLSANPKLLATCDSCKARRVKCTSDSTEGQCHNCIKRHEQCHYSLVKTRRRRRLKLENNSINEITSRTSASREAPFVVTQWNSPPLATPAQTHSSRADSTYRRSSNVSSDHDHDHDQDEPLAEARSSPTLSHVGGFPKTYVDHVLAHHYIPNEVRSEELGFRVYGYFGASSSMAYFSEKRIRSLSLRLGNDRLNKLLETMATIIETRLKPMDQLSSPILASGSSASPFVLGTSEALYINSYFDHVHPVYPFLDPVDFQRRAASSHSHEFAADKSWSALYHAVLSLGCQFNDGGTFEPGKGTAWKYFQVSLSLCGDLILSKGSLMTVQALTAMAVFSLNISCTQLETSLVSEAAKVAQVLGLNKTRGLNDATSIRTFWVLYCLEKSTTFLYGKGSVIMDSDIGCPFLSAPEAVIDGVDWLLAFCRYARILSQAYERLFTASATINSAKSYWIIIDCIREDLETWRASIAAPFQPGGILRGRDLSSPAAVAIAIRLHFYYYNVLLALDRLTLHLCAEEPSCVKRQLSAKKSMMKSARSILELTKFIDVEPYTPTWILAIMPLSALFILFDLVIHNPKHPETKNNIALLDVASGHFSRLEYASNGSIPGSLIAEFAHLARQNISDIQVRGLDLSAKTSTTLVEPTCSNLTPTDSSHDLELSDINNIQYGLETTAMPLTNDALFFPIYDDFNDLERSTMGVDIMDLFDSNIPQFPSYFHA